MRPTGAESDGGAVFDLWQRRVMVSNITYTDAQKLVDELEAVKGVKEVAFDDSEDHYTGTNALYDITFPERKRSR